MTIRRIRICAHLVTLALTACSGPRPSVPQQAVAPSIAVEYSSSTFHRRNGNLYCGDTLFSGILTEHYASGQRQAATPYLHGREQGRATSWYPDGTLMEERIYDHGNKEGVHRGWWEDGTPRFRYTFINDLHEGQAEEWFLDGSPYRSFHYKAGHESGTQRMWNDDGSVKANYVVINGRRYGSIGSKPCRSPQ
jgi:antitoxin component YwqK of YwqJK toxin-antitoxin module